jgi:thiopurine S-methyltransferase
MQFGPSFLAGGSACLVPLCGKSHDLPWLADRLPTLGVELAPEAVAQLHQEHGLVPDVHEHGPYRVWYTAPGRLAHPLCVLEGDLFDLDAGRLSRAGATPDRVWDRAALVALNPAQRRRYVELLRHLLPSGSRILLETFSYDPTVMTGPPHSISESEIGSLFAGCTREILEVRDELEPRWREAGHTWWHYTLQVITLP